ncbi:MAG: CGGC domain-containing protein [Desulfobacteraceae bacterium]|nr:CGGC domain-containing protein [Desulfobacteraceae bacterium]
MAKIAMMRCEKNENKCPLTDDFTCIDKKVQGFEKYDECELVGVFTCRCPGDNAVGLAKILKSKGAEAIHFVTCTFSKKTDTGWDATDGGFCDHIEKIAEKVHSEKGLRCVLGTAHLPEGYTPKVFE